MTLKEATKVENPPNTNSADAVFVEKVKSGVVSGRRRAPAIENRSPDAPMIVAIHGGTYNSSYFDLPGYSLLQRAAALGIFAIALDRPCYGQTTPLETGLETIPRHAERLIEIVGELYERHGSEQPGVCLIGHSIGGATVVEMAARNPSWPLVGIAVSGMCLRTPPESKDAWNALPNTPMVEMGNDIKDMMMFGPKHTLPTEMPQFSHQAHALIPRAELLDIVADFPGRAKELLARVTAPVHYRQGEFDPLWITNAEQVGEFEAALLSARMVDCRLFKGAGHCIDFHLLGASFQLEQLSFALRCGVEGAMAGRTIEKGF